MALGGGGGGGFRKFREKAWLHNARAIRLYLIRICICVRTYILDKYTRARGIVAYHVVPTAVEMDFQRPYTVTLSLPITTVVLFLLCGTSKQRI